MRNLIQALLFAGLMIPLAATGQFSRERSALNNMEKAKWDRAKGLLQKSIRKDSVNAFARYVFACYYFESPNPEYQLDSAYKYVMLALDDYQITELREKEKMLKLPLDSSIIVRKREQIDSAAFERATRINTERAYIQFLNDFPLASQRDRAVELRNEVAYIDALKVNTYQSFLSFLNRYPDSHRAKDARDRYNKLLYEAMTHDKKLASYEKFLAEHPETPYRKEVERQIFQIMTAPGTADAFDRFLRKYPKSSVDAIAISIQFFLFKENNETIPRSVMNDSIRKVIALEEHLLVPFLKDDKFGFFDENGRDVLQPFASNINPDYLCGNISDDILILKDLIVARNGAILFKGEFEKAEDLRNGFLAVTAGKCVRLVHKSAKSIFGNCLLDVRSLKGNYIAAKNSEGWSVYTLTGRRLLEHEWDDIDREGDAIILKKSNSYSITSVDHLDKTADRDELKILFSCNEYRVWREGLIWLRKAGQQALISSSTLTEKIPFGNHALSQEYFGVMTKSSSGYRIVSNTFESREAVDKVKISKPWVGVKKGAGWNLIDPRVNLRVNHQFDSIDFKGPFALGYNSDTLRICFNIVNCMLTSIENRIRFIPGKDSVFFLLIEEGDKKNLYDMHGQRLMSVTYDRIDYFGEDLFQIQKGEKKGLISMNGKVVAQPEFDALGRIQNRTIPVLKDRKFGLIDLSGKMLIKPIYEKNILTYNRNLFIVSKNGYFGLITWSNKSVTDFQFDEIQYWNDSVALTRQNYQWMFYDFVQSRIVMDKIKDLKWVLDSNKEKIVIIHRENNYGVVSNRRGDFIPATFSDIVNVGSSAHPVYFTEKHVEEASIFVVIYYDSNGQLLRRQVFELDDYERIYCSGK